MDSAREEINFLRRLAPEDDSLTVFDAETQETSYGAFLREDLRLFFDTHRKDAWFVSTVEVPMEILAPARTTPDEVAIFAKVAEHHAVQSIPYSACFFKANLHVNAFYGPLRGIRPLRSGRIGPRR